MPAEGIRFRAQSFAIAIVVSLALAAVTLLALPVGTSAKSAEELQRDIARKRSREGALNGDIQELSSKVRGLRGRIGALEAKQSAIEGDLNQKLSRQQNLSDALDESRDRLATLKERLNRSKVILANRIVAVYKAGEPTILTVVLESDGFAQMLERATYMREVAKQDHRIIRAVMRLKGRTRRETTKLASLEAEARRLVATVRARRKQVEDSKIGLARQRAGLGAAVSSRKSVLARVSRSRSDDEESLRAMNRSSSAVSDVLDKAPGPIKRGTGRFIYPINGQFASPFGMRWGRLHAGIDLTAPAGTPIRAADGGTVRYAGWMDGYGNYTCVQHSTTLSSCYAHQFSIGVRVGQSVKQGAVIGKVGNTGRSFGNHLHFEVRVSGNPVDPMGYL